VHSVYINKFDSESDVLSVEYSQSATLKLSESASTTPPAETDKRQLQDVYAGISTDGSPRAITGAMETRHIFSGLDQTSGAESRWQRRS